MLVTLIACLGLGYYVLNHLPVIDFRPYKIGANIQEGMTVPENAPKPIYEYQWKFMVDGKEKTIVTNGDYPQVDGEFIDVETKMIQAGYTPPIHDFTIERDGEDYTQEFLEEPDLVMVIAYSLGNTDKEGYTAIKNVTDQAIQNGYKVIGLSASSQDDTEKLADTYKLNFNFYFCDETTLKTIVRSNPGILLLHNGTIQQKYHWQDAHKMDLPTVENANPQLDLTVKRRLDSIGALDQKYRQLMQQQSPEARAEMGKKMGLSEAEYSGDLWKMQSLLDSTNLDYIENLLNTRGYPGKSMVGEPTNTVAWQVVQHSNKIGTYLPIMKEAGRKGELPMTLVAMMEDRYLMEEGKPQVYGTQGRMDDDKQFIWPIEDAEHVNKRRKEVGFTTTIEEYSKQLFGDDFEYRALDMSEVNTQ